MLLRPLPAITAFALLAGCATAPAPAPEPPPPPPPGMELLLGRPAEEAIALLGKPRLDRREGPARQLQFAGGCLLDLYYYPNEGTVPLATHADSRLADGRDFAAGECLQMLLNARKAAAATPAPSPAPAQTKAAKTKG